ncbi:conserved hypothetical protein [Luminiphilus syltensis NOR5-1B]|uniref:Signaling pathway modulator ZraP n=1 Tax=Luminiphilus syltensis NOR5-1B TaxID=565045 RepID=B8KWT7_9GAMM|nr:periplasmic heavy metal sensor [Luminiphilus syltensis]EED34707.1 conserved hypothetical protein [Luminiphilus syltensis NOR5-1B]
MNSRFWLTAALLVSLSVNLVVAGIVIGRGVGGSERPPPLEWAIKPLDAEIREQLRPVLRAHMSDMRTRRASMRERNDTLLEVINTDPMDPQALEAALLALRQETARYQELMHGIVQDVVSDLPREQRQQVLGMLLHQRGERGVKPLRSGAEPSRFPPPPR